MEEQTQQQEWKVGDPVTAFGVLGWVAEVSDYSVTCDFNVDGHIQRCAFTNGKIFEWQKEPSLRKVVQQ